MYEDRQRDTNKWICQCGALNYYYKGDNCCICKSIKPIRNYSKDIFLEKSESTNKISSRFYELEKVYNDKIKKLNDKIEYQNTLINSLDFKLNSILRTLKNDQEWRNKITQDISKDIINDIKQDVINDLINTMNYEIKQDIIPKLTSQTNANIDILKNTLQSSIKQSLLDEIKGDNNTSKCKICFEKALDVLLPCGHLCVCSECVSLIDICPICRNKFLKEDIKKVYL